MKPIFAAPMLAVWALLLALAGPVGAVEPNERLADPALEARARELSKNLRCLVCQNESIDESGADLAHDLRVLLRQRIMAGDTDEQAVANIVGRYGDFVLLDPPVKPATYVLWFSPIVLLVLAGIGTTVALRRRRSPASASPPPLSDTEKTRVAELIQEIDG
jgi:cytochrome c-type biogenesis protein CcmH